MAARQSEELHSQQPLWSREQLSRSASRRTSNPNIFSDDFALEPLDPSAESSPTDSIQPSLEHLPLEPSHDTPTPQTVVYRTKPRDVTTPPRPSSISKRPIHAPSTSLTIPRRTVSTISQSESTTHRSSSTSSRFSTPRAQSPYRGPTGPSHPYAMYPQVTRASSIASESTVRPVERTFVGGQGPEHPYSLYPQNTVEEEDDPDSVIPLGFPGMGQIYQSRNGHPGNDNGDIVGSDGHVEELPRYTKYADNVVAKGDSNSVLNPPPVELMEPPISPISQHTDSGVEVNMGANRDAGNVPPAPFQEKFSEKRKRRGCLGLPLWTWLIIVGVVVIAGTVGGVVGRNVGSSQKQVAATTTQPQPTATTTVWLDAAPLPSGSAMPPCDIGQWMLPTINTTIDSGACIMGGGNQQYAWGCAPPTGMPFTVSAAGETGFEITFNVSTNKDPFRYGPQLPQLGSKPFPLQPSTDMGDTEWGPTMFFWTSYNKLTILHESDLPSIPQKRDTIQSQQEAPYAGQQAQVGDDPWFCWFNETVFEFFIYVEQTASSANSTSTAAPIYPISTTAAPPASTSPAKQQLGSTITSPPWPQTWSSPPASASTYNTWPSVKERGLDYTPEYDLSTYYVYPRNIKITEKRKPTNSANPPQCFQMHIGKNWNITRVPDVLPFNITENDVSGASGSKRWESDVNEKIRRRNDLSSPCACQWISN